MPVFYEIVLERGKNCKLCLPVLGGGVDPIDKVGFGGVLSGESKGGGPGLDSIYLKLKGGTGNIPLNIIRQ